MGTAPLAADQKAFRGEQLHSLSHGHPGYAELFRKLVQVGQLFPGFPFTILDLLAKYAGKLEI
jgi:hypothetical protein